MKELSLQEIRKIQLDILIDVAEFCDKNNIEYFLNAGTLLGSVRHKGFIPWDDDIDIEMPRYSYDRFLTEYKSTHNFRAISVYSDREYFFPIAKVVSCDTVLERYRRANIDFGVNIDVFPLDSFCSKEQINKIHKKILFFRKLVNMGKYFSFCDMRQEHGIKAILLWPLSSPLLINQYAKAIDQLAKSCSRYEGDLVATIAAPGFNPSEFYRRSDILPTRREGCFEDYVFRIPNKSDSFLRGIYGNYMVLPPIEKQLAPHHHKAYRIENSMIPNEIKPKIKCSVKENRELGDIDVMISEEQFHAAGFDYGDSCNISFSNGICYSNVPFYSGFNGKTNELVVAAYYCEENIKIARCSGASMWVESGCKEGDSVLIQLNDKGMYLKEQRIMNLQHSNNISDYSSPEEFANFRVMNGGRIKAGLVYRGASPINNLYKRADEVGKLLEKNRIRLVANLADNEEKTDEYIRTADFVPDYYMSLYNNAGVVSAGGNCAYRTEHFANRIVNMFRRMMNSDGPYYITCTEGKTRTGFVCILIGCIAGYSIRELEDDYMASYRCYFGITKNKSQEIYSAILDLRFYDIINWLYGVENAGELHDCSLEQAAKAYLIRGGMSEEEYRMFHKLLVRN